MLHALVFASSRMLLITRGAEPKNTSEVFNDFISEFIEAKLISSVYLEIVEIARDEKGYDFTDKRETILELAKAVASLYESMDDSLQFKNIGTPKAEETNKPSAIYKKDFRGVACPMNFVKTKIELAALKSGEILEILLDDGEPIENVPGSIQSEGHLVLGQKKIEDYWEVIIQKG
jgi:sulfite reductase (ferredoxin)